MQQVIYTLLNYINNSINKDTYYHIALSILKHIYKITSFSLEEMANSCHVSPATINRFCKQIGYSNYSNFRAMVNVNEEKVFDGSLLDKDYMEHFTQSIYQNIECVNQLDLKQLDQALRCIHHQNRCVVLGYGSYQNYALDLQKNLFSCGKLLEVSIDMVHQYESILTLGPNDCVIVTSLSGRYLQNPRFKFIENMKRSGCKRILITQELNHPMIKEFDYIIPCGSSEYRMTSKYALFRLYDLISYRYQQLFNPTIID